MKTPQPYDYSTAARFAAMEASDFREGVRDIWTFSKTILDNVTVGVEASVITPLQGVRVISCTLGTLFGYDEFHANNSEPASEVVSQLLSRALPAGNQREPSLSR